MTAMVPFRAAAALSTSSKRDATTLTPHSGATGLAKARKEVPLGSEEGTKGVVQYALYVFANSISRRRSSRHPVVDALM